MIVVNLFGGPGAGKTTLAAYLFYRLKQAGFRAELVGEAAREIIYDRNPEATAAQLIDNQLLISGLQYERLKRLERHKMEIVIADSPLRMGLVYARSMPGASGLETVIHALEREFPHQFNVFVSRTQGVYDKESRAQDEAEAMRLDEEILYRAPRINRFVKWGDESVLADRIIEEAKRGWN